MDYPKVIETQQLEIYEIKEQLQRKRAAIRSLEITITVDCCAAVNEKGKPLLSNETLRAAAISKSLEDSDEYRAKVSEVRGLEHDLAVAEAALERLRMEWRLHLLELEDANHRSAIELADKSFKLRHELPPAYVNGRAEVEPDIQLPF